MDPVFEAPLVAQRRRRRSPLTIKATTQALRSAQRWLDANGIAAGELSLLQCEQYFDELLDGWALSTVQRQLAYLRAAYRYGQRHGLVGHDPTGDVRLPRLPDLQPVTYSTVELRGIYAAIQTDCDEVAFHLLAFAGLRLGETAALTWDDVDLDQQQLRLVGKGGKFRLVPLHPVLQQLLAERCPPGRSDGAPVIAAVRRRLLTPSTLGRQIRALVDRAGVDVESPSHAFRRTVATVMYEQGVRTRVIERILGWAPRRMHERHYLRVADQQLHAAIRTLYTDNPVSDRQTEPLLPPPPLLGREELAAGWLDTAWQQLARLETEIAGVGASHPLTR